ncbi:flagellar biosynthesis protein FlhF [Geomesophilobacter sediminis]|uniref:Flagellar biosynthesis protein FlhF n=1 Tax=Geomesophilobacter sediminis TaxID=2798584 RepID=A0A8J7JK55_9BACT|nr:flagellar biosynthesis protein FlhF [Geomesophilobacter sediminis]MBJ6724815.1 flagellar biosynthesis protein FlhF [Geomesophilobacter sediminis]
MLVKTFQASEMSEALRMVKAEMGLDAMILSSKKERRKGILGWFTKPYFEVTAALEPRPQRQNPYRETQPEPEPEREMTTKEAFQNSMLVPLVREVKELRERVEAMSKKDAAAAAAAREEGRTFGKEDLEEIKKLLYSAVNKEKQEPAAAAAPEKFGPRPVSFPLANPEPVVPAAPTQLPPALAKRVVREEARELSSDKNSHLEILTRELQAEELGPDAIERLMENLRPAAEEGAGMDELREMLSEALIGMVRCAGPVRMKKNGPRIMAIVGPTGVGKTTTIAKLAAMYALTKGSSVAMVTTDNFRVGAIEQLKTYAKIMDLPLEVVATSQELARAISKHEDKDLILIDTAGRSQKDSERLEELRGYLESQQGIEVYLCMAATTRAREMDEIVAKFGVLPINRLLFTKVDESESFGCLVDAHLRHKLPLSYFTTGQKVPEDIEVATPRKIANLVLKESAR